MNDYWQLFIDNLINTQWVEGVAVLFGLFSVWFAARNNIWVYPTGIISVLIYVYICQKFGLYADMGINAFYFIMSVYGWYNWTHQNGKAEERKISQTTKKQKVIIALLLVIFFFVIRFILINFTDSVVPNIDSFTTAVFLIAMWLMALKKIENWTLWIIGDVVSIPLYAYKELVLTSFQYFIFLIIAIQGYISWRKLIKAQCV